MSDGIDYPAKPAQEAPLPSVLGSLVRGHWSTDHGRAANQETNVITSLGRLVRVVQLFKCATWQIGPADLIAGRLTSPEVVSEGRVPARGDIGTSPDLVTLSRNTNGQILQSHYVEITFVLRTTGLGGGSDEQSRCNSEARGIRKLGVLTNAEFTVIKAQPLVGSAPPQAPPTAQASRNVSTSARATWFLVAAVCLLIVAVVVSQLVPGSAWAWVNTGAVACMVLAVVGFFAAPRSQ